MDFFDRKDELDRLTRVTNGGEAMLVVVWGRRRIGKTRLLGEVKWLEGEPAAADIDRAARAFVAKGAPLLAGSPDEGVRRVLFVPRKPRGKLRLSTPGVTVLDAADVLSVLR